MKLLTKKLLAQLPPLGSPEVENKPVAYAKFFTPDAPFSWYPTEGSPKGDDFIFFGYVEGIWPEWGNFRLSELQNIRGKLGFRVIRDEFFTPTSMEKFLRQ